MISMASLLLLTAVSVFGSPIQVSPRAADLSPIIRTASIAPTIIHEFPKGTWVENLVIRESSGDAIVTLLSEPEVWLISTNNSFEPTLLASFPGNLGCLGIVELGLDVFYVAVGNWSAKTATATPGTWSIWELDLSQHEFQKKLIAKLPGAGFLNGITTLNPFAGTILVADSIFSAVWSINTRSGMVDAINVTAMAPEPSLAPLRLGVNGIRVVGDYLYFDNSDTAAFYRIPIDPVTGLVKGIAETIVDNIFENVIVDDFTIDFAGNAWVVSGRGEVLFLGNATSGTTKNIQIIAGSKVDTSITGHTAAKFGTRRDDLERGSLYATTSGGAVNYFFGNWTAGGMVLRYDTAQLL